MPDTHLILHVKGTEQETTSLPKQVVRAAISQGQITHSQLIWSPLHNAWKQVRELPQLWPSQKLAPAPTPRTGTGDLPKIAAEAPASPQPVVVPRVAVKATAPGVPAARAVPGVKVKAQGGVPVAKAAIPAKRMAVPSAGSAGSGNLVVDEEKGPNPLKWLCIGLAVLIVLAVVFNYAMVNRPIASRLGQTAFSNVGVYSHLGAFIQPGVVVIHIPATSALNESNMADFLVALAHSTPADTYSRIALTSGWTGKYSFSGNTWKQLGDMGTEDATQRKEFILDSMFNAAGQPLVSTSSAKTEDAQQAEREKIWTDFVAQFTHS